MASLNTSGNAQTEDIEDPIKLKEEDKSSKVIRLMVSYIKRIKFVLVLKFSI